MIVDRDPSWVPAADGLRAVSVVAPGDGWLDRIAELAPARVIANLARDGAFEALETLRASGSSACFFGYLALPGSGRAVPLGRVEPASSLDPAAILAAVNALGRNRPRVLTAGRDVDAFMSVREAMVRCGMSVSMAWDTQQAADLLAMVRPEVVVLDLALPGPEGGHGFTTRLTATHPAPDAVLIRGAEQPAGRFATVLTGRVRGERLAPLGQIVADVLRGDASRGWPSHTDSAA